MSLKRIATDDEIDALAERFRALWTPGDVVRPWFRQNREMILDLVHGAWSWAAIASALTKAGITYRTGRPWTAQWLRGDFSRAQVPLKGYARRRQLQTPMAGASDLQLPSMQMASSPEIEANRSTTQGGGALPDSTAKSEPRFKPVSIKPYEPRRAPTEEELAQIERNRMHALGRK